MTKRLRVKLTIRAGLLGDSSGTILHGNIGTMRDLFRRDQASTISGPNPDDTSTYAEHVVHARGKRTRYTSVSTSPDAIRDFGEQLWKLTQPKVTDAGHIVISQEELLRGLRKILEADDHRLRELAARAIPRVNRRREALVDWQFVIDGIERKDRMAWAENDRWC